MTPRQRQAKSNARANANEDLERLVLGQALEHGPHVVPALRAAGIDDAHFSRDAHARLWRAVVAVADTGRPPDLVAVVEALRARGDVEIVSPAFAASLAGGNPRWAPANIAAHAETLISLARSRQLVYDLRRFADLAEQCDGRQLEDLRPELEAATRAAFDGSPKGRSRAPRLVRLDDVAPERIRWLWPGRLAAGKLHLLAGDPGLGKSTVTLDLAARLSRGAAWPDGASGGAPCDVLLLQAEDGLADTVRPRLDLLGADVARVHAITGIVARDSDGWIALDRDLPEIRTAAERTRAAVFIVDPLTAYLGPDVDSYRDADVRRLLGPLAAMAADLSLAVIAVMHLRKGGEARALARIGGSVGFGAAARLVLAVAADPDDEDRRLLLPVKANITAPAPTLAFRVLDGRLVWEPGPVEGISVDALLNARPNLERAETTDAEAVIAELLADETAWPLDARDALAAGRQHGIAERTLRGAARRIGIQIRRLGFGRGGRWLWHRPIAANVGASAHCTESAAAMPEWPECAENEARDTPDHHTGEEEIDDEYTVPR